ncbi:hypothetical protein H5410_026383 [Solanum commersonii]|uniref:Pentatricopeptide repeat-containing protein n=1 Tax=Solanum commersonii TaxID=4109 RepID=A0A9J5YVY7_SOLCO|nr:hypothetical protein H5410_026383 [Solanum commersonii]
MILYLQKAGVDLFKVMYLVLRSSSNTTPSTLVADELIKVFAANKLFDHTIDNVNLVKKMGLEPSIYSCKLLKCLAVASQGENLAILFEIMKNSGPSPDVMAYTSANDFYCTNHPGNQKVSIKDAYKILKEMKEKQISFSAATYSVWLHGLCRVGCPDVALEFIRKLRYENQTSEFLLLQCYYSWILCGRRGILVIRFCNLGIIDGGLCPIQGMQDNNIRTTPISYNSILQVDQTTCYILITEFCAQGDLSSAGELLGEIISSDLASETSICLILIYASFHMGSVDKALQYMIMMIQKGYLSDT